MTELEVDIGQQQSKTLHQYLAQPFDYVITVCDQANETCPVSPTLARASIGASPTHPQAHGDEAAQLAVYRDVRDNIAAQLQTWLNKLDHQE
jgi:arsenate reductase